MNYDCIVLSGGALKGIAILGCLQSLKDQKKLENVKKYIATSAGAIISYLICIGYTPIEIMVDICINDWIEKLANFDVLKAVNGMGAISFSTVGEMLERLTIEKIGRLITLGELYHRYEKLLICCTYNYSRQMVEFLDGVNHPELPCVVALRMSSNLPILFEPFYYETSYYIDGGILCNFPLHKIDIEADKVLAIKIKKMEKREGMDYRGKNFINFVHDLIFIPSIAYEDMINKEYEKYCDLIEIDLDKYSCLNFNASKNDRLDIFSHGYNHGKSFLEKKNDL